MKYKLIPQPENSWNENPCWDCIFKGDDPDMGDCNAPQEVKESEEYNKCGYPFDNVFIEDCDYQK